MMAGSEGRNRRPGSSRIQPIGMLLFSLQARLRGLSRGALEKIPENSILEGAFSKWTIGANVYELALGKDPDIQDWPGAELEHLDQQLKDGEVHVEISDGKEISVKVSNRKDTAGSNPPNLANGFDSNSSTTTHRRNRLRDRLRDRLIQTIETAIGRPIHQRSSKAIDPRLSDPNPPNLYEWQFNQEYPSFPTNRGGISRWSAEQIRYCNEALDQGQLTVIVVEHGSAEQAEMRQQQKMLTGTEEEVDDSFHRSHSDQDNEYVHQHQSVPPNSPSSIPSQHGNGIPSPSGDDVNSNESNERPSVPISEMEQSFKEEAESINEQTKNIHGLMKGLSEMHSRMVNTMFDMVRAKQIQELEQTLKSKHEMKVNKFKKEIDELEEKLCTEEGAKHDAVAMVSECQMQINTLKEQTSRQTDGLGEIVAAAKREGEIAGENKAIQHLSAINERAQLPQHRSYLDELEKAKNDSYQRGLEAGRQTIDVNSRDIEELKQTHADELKAVREAGRHEGRDMAYKELALGPEDEITNLIQGHNELNTNRKVRELKTIHQNWGEPPQKALPSWMLPQGHTPGDKTLYFLAKLSKEVNATRASQLLTEEIDRRCLNLPKDAKNRIVTNTDIKSVLDSIRPPNAMDTSHTRSLEPSITPQPPAPQSSRKEATAVKSVIQSHPPNKAPASSQVSPVQTSGQGQNITARNSNVQSMKKNLNKSHQPQEQTPSRCNPPTQGTASQFQEQSIERILKLSLPPPPRMNLSSGLQNFSSKFVQKHIGGVESTFATVSIDKRDQAVPWHVIIRANTVAHRYAPRLGVHGALTLVQGKPNNGIIGNTYPVILKTDTDKHSYIGHYEVVSRHTLPVAAWLDEAEGTRIRIAKELADTKWGEQLLRKRDIKCDGATLSDRIDQILRCFESDSSQPHLRAEWVVLQLKTFKHDQYNNLLAELATEYYPGADKDVQSVSEAPQQDFVEWYKKQWLADRPKSDRFDRLPAHPKSWDHLIAEVGEKDQMFGKPYKSPAEITLLKEYIVELTLGKKGFVLPKIGELHSTKILEVFNTVLAIFIQHNEELREQQQIDHAERHAKRHKDSFQERGQSSTASASQKRRRVGGEAQPTKRSKIISRTSIPEVMLNSWEKNIDGLLVEEPNGSTIFVDTAGSEEPEVKIDEDNGVEEDLYNATPAPKGRGKPRKAAGA